MRQLILAWGEPGSGPQVADIDGFCDERLEFLQRLGKLWRVFERGGGGALTVSA